MEDSVLIVDIFLFWLLYLYPNALTHVREFLAKLVDARKNRVQVNNVLRKSTVISVSNLFDNVLELFRVLRIL